jgi:hypothetical protein
MSGWLKPNRTTHIRQQCRKATVSSCYRCQINTGVEKNELHLNIDLNFEHQMSLSKSKHWYSDNCLQFRRRAVPLYEACKQQKRTKIWCVNEARIACLEISRRELEREASPGAVQAAHGSGGRQGLPPGASLIKRSSPRHSKLKCLSLENLSSLV